MPTQTQTGGWSANPNVRSVVKIFHYYANGSDRSLCGRARKPKEPENARQHPPGQGCASCVKKLSEQQP